MLLANSHVGLSAGSYSINQKWDTSTVSYMELPAIRSDTLPKLYSIQLPLRIFMGENHHV
jgi:hypothetical protein